MIFIVLTFMFSSFLFALRTLNSLFDENKIKFHGKLVIEAIFFISWILFGLMFAVNFLSTLLLSLAWLVFFLVLHKFGQNFVEKSFRNEAEAFIDRVILNLLSGNSFRAACLHSSKLGDAFSQQEIKKILLESLFQRPQECKITTAFAKFFKNELHSIDLQPHMALTRTKGLRRNLALESEFRQRSDQIRGRIWIQSVFMLGLYIAMLFFLCKQSGSLDFVMLAISATFFATGFAWTLLDGRKMKWKT